ncbi:MAG: hypothetical protein ABSD88_15250 [Candidatus Korobacteraceae bacterium]|jgi:hypothetical protein
MKTDPQAGPNESPLNEYQQRALLAACQHIDKLLVDIEAVLSSTESRSVFPKYVDDLLPVQRQGIAGHIERLRAQLIGIVTGQGINPEQPKIAASHAIHTALTFVEIAVEELRPEKMRGYGQVSKAGIAELNGLVQEIFHSTRQLHRYVLPEKGPAAVP